MNDSLSVGSAPNRDGVCDRCDGTGISPSDPSGKLCRKCYGTGAYNEHFVFRTDGRVEEMCEHGVGHTVSIRGVTAGLTAGEQGGDVWWAHGCDGCCRNMVRYE